MKRLQLKDFQANKLQQDDNSVDQLLGQVLGNCHDGTVKNKFSTANSGVSTNVKF